MRLRSQRGMTLVEAMAASVILILVVFTFANISDYSFLAFRKNNRNAEALQVAEQQLNEAKTYLKLHQALPQNTTQSVYTVKFQKSAWTGASPSYDMSGVLNGHVSLQSVVLLGAAPALVTVTVSWSD